MPETVMLKSGTQANPVVIDGTGINYDYIWGNMEHDCVVRNAVITDPPPGDMPKMFGCSRIRFENCTIQGVRANGAHVEGCQDIAWVDCLFDDNDIFHVFVTQWGTNPAGVAYPMPKNITFERCRFGPIGPGGGYYSVLCRENVIPVAGMEFRDCQRKGPGISPADIKGADSIVVVAPNAPWPAFGATTPPPVEPPITPIPAPPLIDTLEPRVTALEAQVKALTDAAYALDSRVDVIESDMRTLG
jgi:hypothetical protein